MFPTLKYGNLPIFLDQDPQVRAVSLHPVFPQKTSLDVIPTRDVLWDVHQQYEDALCIPSEHGSYTETQQRQVTSGKTRCKLSSLKARAGLIYLRHPELKAVVCPTIPHILWPPATLNMLTRELHANCCLQGLLSIATHHQSLLSGE